MKFRYYGFHLKISGAAAFWLFASAMASVYGGSAINNLAWLGFAAAGGVFLIFLSQLIFQHVVVTDDSISIGKPFPKVIMIKDITKITNDKEKWLIHSPTKLIKINPNGLKEKDLKVMKVYLAGLNKKLSI
jgi:hypothetical protein